jgi:hypothetical protein
MSIPSNTMFLGVDPSKVNLTEKKSRILNGITEYYSIEDFGGGGIEGTDYVFVSANGTDVENAAELQAAYTTAQGMSPSSSKRITVIVAPGRYNFGSSTMNINTSFIDVVSLTGDTDVILTTTATVGLSASASNALIRGINVSPRRFEVGNTLSQLRVEKCVAGERSFGAASNLTSTLVDCTAGQESFGWNGTMSGTLINCTSLGVRSFGFQSTVSGIFINCKSSDQSFGYSAVVFGGLNSFQATFIDCVGAYQSFAFNTVTGSKFTRCVSGAQSFGYNGTITSFAVFTDCDSGDESFGSASFPGNSQADGFFIRCKSGGKSFGWNGYAIGTFIDCEVKLFGESFGGASSAISGQDWGAFGTFIRCKSGNNSFGYVSEAGGTFTDCVAGNLSFGSFSNVNASSNASGTFTRCISGDSSFGNLCPASGTFTDCVAGTGSFGSGISSIASGVFNNCIGGLNSFGKNGSSLTGKLYYCRLTSGTFATVSGSGVTRLCIDGNNAENNQ